MPLDMIEYYTDWERLLVFVRFGIEVRDRVAGVHNAFGIQRAFDAPHYLQSLLAELQFQKAHLALSNAYVESPIVSSSENDGRALSYQPCSPVQVPPSKIALSDKIS